MGTSAAKLQRDAEVKIRSADRGARVAVRKLEREKLRLQLDAEAAVQNDNEERAKTLAHAIVAKNKSIASHEKQRNTYTGMLNGLSEGQNANTQVKLMTSVGKVAQKQMKELNPRKAAKKVLEANKSIEQLRTGNELMAETIEDAYAGDSVDVDEDETLTEDILAPMRDRRHLLMCDGVPDAPRHNPHRQSAATAPTLSTDAITDKPPSSGAAAAK